ncbi:MAG: low temperature requirement protein A [Candidatus Dormiibacterota bacterium]
MQPDAGAPHTPHRPWRVPMIARDPAQRGRASTPLEAFFDLCFVVAVAQAAAQLHTQLAAGEIAHAVGGYLLVFFGIWWAWMNFTWFASAYDTDDVPYRLLTLVQIAGALVFAAGVAPAMESGSFAVATVGYVIMRVAMVTQWLRAAAGHVEGRPAAARYAIGVGAVQVGWLLRLLVPGISGIVAFVLLALCEMAVPVWAESRGRETSWNAGHVSERYGLFTIIVLGESVAGATGGVQSAISARGVSASVIVLALAGLVLVFGVWWTYFKHDAAEGLKSASAETHLRTALTWGYGHFGIFAAIAALGAGLELAFATSGEGRVAGVTAALAIAIPGAIYLVLLPVVHARLARGRSLPPLYNVLAAVLLLLVALAASLITLPFSVAGMAVVVALLLAGHLAAAERPPAPVSEERPAGRL